MLQELGATTFPPGIFTEAELEILKDLEDRQMTQDTTIPPGLPIIKIGDDIEICSGEILILSARPKAQKSGAIGFLISGVLAMSDECHECIPDLKILPASYMHEGKRITKAVIHIDTEQPKKWHKINQVQSFKRVGLTECPAFYKSYNFRSLKGDLFKQYVETILKDCANRFDGIHILFLDGVADFVSSVNNEDTSQDIYRWLFNITDTYNCAIVASLHLNPGIVKKMRGHVGSDAERKVDAVIGLTKTDGVVSWEAEMMRGSDNFPLIQTRYSKEHGNFIYHGTATRVSESEKEEIKATKEKVKAITHAESVFKSDRPAILPAKEIKRLLMQGFDMSKASALRIFNLMKDYGAIESTPEGNWKRKF
jgi:hypothetical protein